MTFDSDDFIKWRDTEHPTMIDKYHSQRDLERRLAAAELEGKCERDE